MARHAVVDPYRGFRRPNASARSPHPDDSVTVKQCLVRDEFHLPHHRLRDKRSVEWAPMVVWKSASARPVFHRNIQRFDPLAANDFGEMESYILRVVQPAESKLYQNFPS